MKDRDCLSLSDKCDEPIQAVTTTVLLFLPHVSLNTSKLREEEVKVAVRGLLCLCCRLWLLDLDPTSSSMLPAHWCIFFHSIWKQILFSFNALFTPEYSLLSSTVWDLQSWLKLPTWIFSLFQASFRTMSLAVSSWRLTMILGEHWVMVCLLGTNHEVFYF